MTITGRLPELLAEYAEVETALADPAVHADADRARTLGRRFAELAPVVAAADELDAARDDLAAARELAAEDASFAAEADALETRIGELEDRLRHLLLPKDPDDGKDVILEVKAGEGGEESALFAGDLLRMYLRYAERQGWAVEVLDDEPTDLGGKKSVTIAVRARKADQPGVGAAEVRGRRAPRAAGAGHRVAGAHPHRRPPACSCCPRPRTSRSRSTPTTCASTCTARPGRAGRASTPPTRPCGSPTSHRARS